MTQHQHDRNRDPWVVDGVVSVGPGTYANTEEVVARIAEVSGFEPSSPRSIRGHISRRGRYVRHREDGSPAIVTGSPLLDSVASASGEIVIDGHVVRPPNVGPTRAAASVCQPGPYEGLETCFSEDGTRIDIRADDDSYVTFHSWNERGFARWTLGTSLSARGPDFERAAIWSRYYFHAYAQVCAVTTDNDHDSNDSYMAESEEGWSVLGAGEVPHRVESLCQVQWNGYRLQGIVSAGETCFTVGVPAFPEEFPHDWPPPTPPEVPEVSVSPHNLTFSPRATSPRSTKRVRVRNTFNQAMDVTVGPVRLDGDLGALGIAANPFSKVSGQLTIPADDSVEIEVRFDGSVVAGNAATAAQRYTGRFNIDSDQGPNTVRLEGRLIGTATVG
jgi:hypothetical protein